MDSMYSKSCCLPLLRYYLFVMAIFPSVAIAESASINEPLVSDRPDFTESTQTVPAGHLQFEAGYTFTQESADGETSRSHALPEALLRIGLSDFLEARLAWEGALIDDPDSERSSHGSADSSIGAKVGLGSAAGVAFGAIVDMELPTGSNNRSADRVQPGVKLLWSSDITDSLAVAGNVNYASRVSEGDRFTEWGASLSLGTALTDTVGAYFEFFGIYPDSTPAAGAESYLNGGITYLVSNDLQLDARVGGGLNDNAADLFSGVGLAWRY